MGSRDIERWNLQVSVIGWLVMGVSEKKEARGSLRFLVWAGGDSFIHTRREPGTGTGLDHWGGLEYQGLECARFDSFGL